jgi:hypothetical protein
MAEKCIEMPYNLPTFSIPRPSKIYPNWDFVDANELSGNPAADEWF